jgi:hypothetical protein
VYPNKRLNAERLQKLESTGFAWSAKNVRKPKVEPAVSTFADAEAASNNNLVNTPTTTLNLGNATASKPFSFPGGTSPTNNSNSLWLVNDPTTIQNNHHNNHSTTSAASANANRMASRLNQAQWQDMFAGLQAYKLSDGDCLVPRKYDQDPKLATWVETQRVLWNRDYRTASSTGDGGGNVVGGEKEGGDVTNHNNNNHEASTAPSPPTEEEWQDDRGGVVVLPDAAQAVLQDAAQVAGTTVETCLASEINVIMEDADGVASPFQSHVPSASGVTTNVNVVNTHVANVNNATPVKRLTPESKQLLDDIGFVWSLRSKRIEDHWDEMFRQLVQHKEAHEASAACLALLCVVTVCDPVHLLVSHLWVCSTVLLGLFRCML